MRTFHDWLRLNKENPSAFRFIAKLNNPVQKAKFIKALAKIISDRV